MTPTPHFERNGVLIHGSAVDSQGGEYHLGIREDAPKDEYRVVVNFNSPGAEESGFPITARDMPHYRRSYPHLPEDPTKQYLEIGPGLGGFIPYLVHSYRTQLRCLPIAIDPANFAIIQLLIKSALDQQKETQLSPADMQRLELLYRRCLIMRDDTKVRLISTTAARAARQHPDIRQIADVVIDHYGACLYPQTECEDGLNGSRLVREARRAFLKEGGIELANN